MKIANAAFLVDALMPSIDAAMHIVEESLYKDARQRNGAESRTIGVTSTRRHDAVTGRVPRNQASGMYRKHDEAGGTPTQ